MGSQRREFAAEYKNEAVRLVINTGRAVLASAHPCPGQDLDRKPTELIGQVPSLSRHDPLDTTERGRTRCQLCPETTANYVLQSDTHRRDW